MLSMCRSCLSLLAVSLSELVGWWVALLHIGNWIDAWFLPSHVRSSSALSIASPARIIPCMLHVLIYTSHVATSHSVIHVSNIEGLSTSRSTSAESNIHSVLLAWSLLSEAGRIAGVSSTTPDTSNPTVR